MNDETEVEPRRASWRDYTIHPDGHHDWKVEPNGAYVLCRSSEGCEEAVYNPERAYLDLGTAVDWARTHHAEHLRNLIADDPEGYRDTMREAFKRGGPEALYDMTNPQGSKLILDDPERGQSITVTFDDGRQVKAWFMGYGIRRCKESDGVGDADMLDLTLIIPDDPRRAEMHFRDTFEPVAPRRGPNDCACPDELEFHPDCPIHQPAPGQCRWCSGWDGTHALRDCRGKRE